VTVCDLEKSSPLTASSPQSHLGRVHCYPSRHRINSPAYVLL